MEPALAAGGMVIGLLLKSLFQKYVMGGLRKMDDCALKRLLLYGDGCTSLTSVWPAKAYQFGKFIGRLRTARK